MAPPIRPLSVDLVHRIAAGEVIDSLAAVVRELTDNALDAGATRIMVSLWPQDWRVQVTDNGWGLSPADLEQAATPHTTSKLSASEDLWQIDTLGFRGEALHSLAQVGQLEICSCPASGLDGWRTVYSEQGQVLTQERVAIAPGTVVTVNQIFAHWPERRQVLPPPTRQMRAVQAVIHEQALCHPQVTWQTHQNDRPWFNIAPGQSAQEILPQLLGTVHPGDLRRVHIPLSPPTEHNSLELIVGLPDRCHRHRPDWIRVAVNGRCVQVISDQGPRTSWLGPLEQSILGAFRQTLPRHRYPLCFVHLQVAPAQVDWNHHPAKREIYLQHLDLRRQQVAEAIQQALQLPEPGITSGYNQRARQLIKTAEGQGTYHLRGPSQLIAHLNGTDPAAEQPLSVLPDQRFMGLKAIAQLHQTYIVAEHPTGVWLIEQHIAHERVLYEQLCQDWQLMALPSPVMLSDLTSKQVAQLAQLGLEIDPFGTNLWAVRSLPQCLAQRSDREAAVLELSHCAGIEAALVATACRSALRNGTPLELVEMQALLDQWQRTRQPRTCPHGRPIYLAMEETDLARFFRRHWVIGKSHGV